MPFDLRLQLGELGIASATTATEAAPQQVRTASWGDQENYALASRHFAPRAPFSGSAVRGIPADPVVLRQDWLDAYNYVTNKGALALDDYARTNDPFSKIGKTQVSVEVASVIRASDDSFRVDWVERHYVDNALAATERWSAILTIVVQTPTDADRLKKNLLGVYVHALNWSKELG